MSKSDAAIIEFGSSKITVIIGSQGVNGTFDIKGQSEIEYEGYLKDEWLSVESLETAVSKALEKAGNIARKVIKEIYVGVPGGFCYSIVKESSLKFAGKTRINRYILNELFEKGEADLQFDGYTCIQKLPLYYVIDETTRTVEAMGQNAIRLLGKISYIVAENNFLEIVESVLNCCNVQVVNFYSTPLCEAVFLFDEETREKGVLFCDCGHIASSVAFVQGEGLCYVKSFSRGGGYIDADLSFANSISYNDAVKLKRQVSLMFSADINDKYQIKADKGEIMSFSVKDVNQVVIERIKNIAILINKCLKSCSQNIPNYMPLYIVGGGLCYVAGAREIISEVLQRPVEIAESSLPAYNKLNLIAEYSVLNYALKTKLKKSTLLGKFFGRV